MTYGSSRRMSVYVSSGEILTVTIFENHPSWCKLTVSLGTESDQSAGTNCRGDTECVEPLTGRGHPSVP